MIVDPPLRHNGVGHWLLEVDTSAAESLDLDGIPGLAVSREVATVVPNDISVIVSIAEVASNTGDSDCVKRTGGGVASSGRIGVTGGKRAAGTDG